MDVIELPDVATFLASAGEVLERDPAANNLPLGIAQQLVDRPGSYEEAFFWVAEHDGEIVGAAMRTSPYPVVVADPARDGNDVVDAFVSTLAVAQPALPGVTANEPWASRFAEAWTAATGSTWRSSIAQGVYALTEVRPPDPATGVSRDATIDDRAHLMRWMRAFEAEALQAMIRDEHATERAIDARLAPGATGGFTLWEVDGRPVSMTGWTPITGGARIGPVYTPPEDRGQGYASNLVADVSARMLGRGASACFLFTDLGNPTSNAIYRRVGYEQVAESSMIVFDEPGD
jgi:predicted GNAT family acetyltransferase